MIFSNDPFFTLQRYPISGGACKTKFKQQKLRRLVQVLQNLNRSIRSGDPSPWSITELQLRSAKGCEGIRGAQTSILTDGGRVAGYERRIPVGWVSWWIRAAWWSGSLWLREVDTTQERCLRHRSAAVAVFVLAENSVFLVALPIPLTHSRSSFPPLFQGSRANLLALRPPSNRAIAHSYFPLSLSLATSRFFFVAPAAASEGKHFLIPVRVTHIASESDTWIEERNYWIVQ